MMMEEEKGSVDVGGATVDSAAVEVDPEKALDGSGTEEKEAEKPDDDEKDPTSNDADNADADEPIILTLAQAQYGFFMSDCLLYLVVLNMAAEFVETVVVQSFSISILMAITLKIFLEIGFAIEHWIKHLCCVKLNRKILGSILMWAVIFASKFVILWIDDAIFGRWVELGKFVNVIILCLVMVAVQRISRFLFFQLGKEKPFCGLFQWWPKCAKTIAKEEVTEGPEEVKTCKRSHGDDDAETQK